MQHERETPPCSALLATLAKAQVIYLVQWESDTQDKNEGIRCFTEWKGGAKKHIYYYTTWESDTDLIVYLTEWKGDSGWETKSKKDLFQ